MKRIYTLILLLSLVIMGASAQIEEFFNRYSDTDGVTSVYISKSLLRMMPDVKTDGVDLKGLGNKLESIRVLTTEDKALAEKLQSDLKKDLKVKDYEELLKVNEGKEKTMIYMKTGKNGVNEYLIINQETGEFNAIQIMGKITPDDIQNMVNE